MFINFHPKGVTRMVEKKIIQNLIPQDKCPADQLNLLLTQTKDQPIYACMLELMAALYSNTKCDRSSKNTILSKT